MFDPENANDHCFFPNSKSLELFDCTLRIGGVLSVTKTHQETLRRLILTKVTIAPNDSGYWCEMADMCKDTLPNLKHLRLTKFVTFPLRQFSHKDFEHGIDKGPISKRWRAASEDAMSDEWTMGDTNGTVQECIGFK